MLKEDCRGSRNRHEWLRKREGNVHQEMKDDWLDRDRREMYYKEKSACLIW